MAEYNPLFNPLNYEESEADRLSRLIGGIDASLNPEAQQLVDARQSSMGKLRQMGSSMDSLRNLANEYGDSAIATGMQPIELDPRSPLRPPSERQGLMYKEVKNPILRGLQRLTRNRMVQKGLLESPTDIASQDVARITQRNRAAESDADTSQNLYDRVEMMRQNAEREVYADPNLGLEDPEVRSVVLPQEQLTDIEIREAGLDMNQDEQLRFSVLQGDVAAMDEYRRSMGDSTSPFYVADRDKRNALLTLDNAALQDTIEAKTTTLTAAEIAQMGLPPGSVIQRNDITGALTKTFIPDQTLAAERERNGRLLNGFEREFNKGFAKEVLDWTFNGGEVNALTDIGSLEAGIDLIVHAADTGTNTFTGAAINVLPDTVRALMEDGQDALLTRGFIRQVVMKSLREILGGQFAFQEGERLIANTYNEDLPPEVNAQRVRSLIKALKMTADNKNEMIRHYEKYGTLFGQGDAFYSGRYGQYKKGGAEGHKLLADDLIEKMGSEMDYSQYTKSELTNLLQNNGRIRRKAGGFYKLIPPDDLEAIARELKERID
tara:strand:+ start:57 stop:1703 length:1647 start_codon:yes stop_codon:yes gene_type:complete